MMLPACVFKLLQDENMEEDEIEEVDCLDCF